MTATDVLGDLMTLWQRNTGLDDLIDQVAEYDPTLACQLAGSHDAVYVRGRLAFIREQAERRRVDPVEYRTAYAQAMADAGASHAQIVERLKTLAIPQKIL